MTVDIGDSRTNNGFNGDSGTQSNDAEIQIGGSTQYSDHVAIFDDLRIFGNDSSPTSELVISPDIVTSGSEINITVMDKYLAWDNNEGISDHFSSPYLHALNGQADSEGPINYDIFASFNRVISSNSRIGAGVGEVTICLRTTDEGRCFASVPTSSTILLMTLGLVGLGSLRIKLAVLNLV
ncbi:hypothetical protein [Zooshikella ganghwensis]|uniref:Uncharacterized protein n=1 Tax=Zooshikella ganghwensis TaxID=202772 RepID=A0A4P9VIG2_9GAMM|nr:hypothetical protein [Zooshikella ganghwensis]RDH41432.1 hypothetical protein B9G39_28660 [Zooshikella ganghwensis]